MKDTLTFFYHCYEALLMLQVTSKLNQKKWLKNYQITGKFQVALLGQAKDYNRKYPISLTRQGQWDLSETLKVDDQMMYSRMDGQKKVSSIMQERGNI